MNLKHVAIIPDGNRRWAKEKGLPVFEGHRRGFDRAFELTKKARDLNIKILTLWAFSTENWTRKQKEINNLMNLYGQMVDKYLQEALKNEVRLIHLGRKDRINDNLKKKIVEAEKKTENFKKYYLCIALDYGGKDEIIRTVQKIRNLDEKLFEKFLDTKDLPYPDVDLVIRTGGENRTSGFMIWQASYSEYMFSPKYFPDFTTADFEECIKEYLKRPRRFGK